MRTLILILLLCLVPRPATAQCAVGPDGEAQRALQTAFEAQSAVHEHLEIASLDRMSREMIDGGRVAVQATIALQTRSVQGFSVCDDSEWRRAKLSNAVFTGGAGIGIEGLARVELRALGVSDSIIQSSLTDYYPDKQIGARAEVPGATGAGHGLWSARLEVLDEVAITAGRVSSHSIRHSVGWEEEVDEDGHSTIVRSHTHHWSDARAARTFVALGAPRLGSTDLVMGAGRVERASLSTPWLVVRPRQPIAMARIDGHYDGLVDVPVVGIEVSPLAGPFADRRMPLITARSATELSSAVLREAGITGRLGQPLTNFGAEAPGDLWAVEIETGVRGGKRLGTVVPGATVRADIAVPIIAVLRISGWAAVNRASTIHAIPESVGRAEWGVSAYMSYVR